MNVLRFTALALAVWTAPLGALAQSAPTGGDWIVDARLRYEGVVQDGLRDADAVTLRTRFGYETPVWRGLRALGEVEGVAQLTDAFNDTVNGNSNYAVVPDPEAFELNRLQLSWSGAEGRRAVLGRQRIILNNARFVGNGGFRQNEQTFDAVRLEARPFAQAGFTYVYIGNVRRNLGDESPQGEWGSDSHALQADIDLPFGRANVYGLLLDFRDDAPAQSSRTFGVRWSKEWEAGAFRSRLTLEAAAQSEYGSNPADFDLGYQHAEFALRRDRWTLTAGGERLEGNGARGFSTPLGALHVFQGWADVFLITPVDGVRDLYGGVAYTTAGERPLTFNVVAHDFSDDGGGAGFGGEVDASARMAISERFAIEAAAAFFDGDDPRFADRDKVWLTLEYRL